MRATLMQQILVNTLTPPKRHYTGNTLLDGTLQPSVVSIFVRKTGMFLLQKWSRFHPHLACEEVVHEAGFGLLKFL